MSVSWIQSAASALVRRGALAGSSRTCRVVPVMYELGDESGKNGSEKIRVKGTGTYVDNIVAQNVGGSCNGGGNYSLIWSSHSSVRQEDTTDWVRPPP